MGDDELSQICINPLFVWQGSRMLSAICQAWNCSKSQPTRAKFRFKLVRRQLYSVHLCAWLLCHGRCPPGPESRLWTLRGYQIRKVWLYEPVCINWFHQTTRKSHWFGVQKKEPSRDEVSAQRRKTCLKEFGISIPGFGRSRFSCSKPGDFNVAWFEISEKRR